MNKPNVNKIQPIADEQKAIAKKRIEMLGAAKVLDELKIGWTEAEESCAIADSKSADPSYI